MTASLDRLTAALAGRYRIERELGAGGMATVYMAHDLRHDRKVAVKVLRPELAAVIGADRFLAEIRTTANLQHPHILPLFDSGVEDSFLFYVMPLVEGISLRDLLNREKQLPIRDAVRIASEVASALDYAHRHGVIHRDIKPENVMLHDGRALVADFGIALAASRAGGTRMTETGMSLGTPHYMSPEQAMGEREIDARSDVYALGCVTYEMLVGEPPFNGPTAQAIIARVMTEEPRSLILQRRSVPPQVEDAVLTALEKLPPDRFASTAEFAAALTGGSGAWASPRRSAAAGLRERSTPRWRRYAPFALGALLLAVALAGWLRPPPRAAVSRHRVALWRHGNGSIISPSIDRLSNQAAIAPDGSSIVFSDSVGGTTQLLLKRRDQSEPVLLPGTERGISPFLSPDGAWIGYLTADGALKKVPAGGGGSITLAEGLGSVYFAAAWLDDGTIVYVKGGTDLHRVPSDGGPATQVLSDSAGRRRLTVALAPLPGSRGFLFTTCPGNCVTGSAVHVFDFAADSARRLVANAAGAWYSPTGHLLYTDRAGGLYAAGFDPERLALTSGAVPVLDDVVPASFALSASGSALYALAGGRAAAPQLVWVSRDGTAEPVDSTWRGEFDYPAISPDGSLIAVALRDGATHLWIRRPDGTRQKLTEDGTINWRPSWTPDGRSVAFASNRSGGESQDDMALYQMPVDGSSPPALLHRHVFGLWEAELSRDGEWLVFRSDEASGVANIRARRLRGDTALRPIALGRGGNSQQAVLSPDGRWLAYAATATGQREVYVIPFPEGGAGRLVSRDGGSEPRWARSGRELFYKSGGRLMTVPVTPGPPLHLGAPRALFSIAGYRGARNRQQYDVAPGDQRFLMIRNPDAGAHAEAVYVENWFAELKEKLRGRPRQ